MSENLRMKVRLIKAYTNLRYKDIANILKISESSMYNWLNHQYKLSQSKEKKIEELYNKTFMED